MTRNWSKTPKIGRLQNVPSLNSPSKLAPSEQLDRKWKIFFERKEFLKCIINIFLIPLFVQMPKEHSRLSYLRMISCIHSPHAQDKISDIPDLYKLTAKNNIIAHY